MNKEQKIMAKAYRELFDLTGYPLFFTLQKQAEKGNVVTLHNTQEKVEDLTL